MDIKVIDSGVFHDGYSCLYYEAVVVSSIWICCCSITDKRDWRDEMNGNKACSQGSPCPYRCQNSGSIGWGCNYLGYCDFQLPRDSRNEGRGKLSIKDVPPPEEANMI